jgi:4-hydroxythreonine-4-phosphate dehydrogenase
MKSKQNPTLRSTRIKVGITIGDPSGIGPAITAKAVGSLRGKADFVVIGDKWVFDKVKVSGLRPQDVEFIDLKNIDRKRFSFGKIKAEYGRASIEYLDKAMELLRRNKIDCLVTCPISKEAINLAGYHYSGHTEYFKEKDAAKDIVMFLLNEKMRFALATRHIPLNKVSSKITQETLKKTIFITYKSLQRLFAIKNPRLVICGINPHASDNGVIGSEENKIVKPAARKLRRVVKNLEGPITADVAIYRLLSGRYDCAIAMYHDQALIPLKLSGFDKGVNMTLGLSFIRTSPLHGTAFDIAKKSKLADPSSLIAAVKLAIQCTRNLKKA